MDTQKTRHTETGMVSGISRPTTAVSARLRLIRPVLWLTVMLMLSLLLSTAVLAGNYYRDADGDGYGDPNDRTNKATTGYVSDNTDCDDTDSTVHPNAVEICENNVDNDCDGAVDEGCVTWYADADSDTYGDPSVSTVAAAQPAGYVSDNTDCDDTNGAIHPGAAEVCDGTNDEDCDGTVDEGCSTWYNDYDGDTYGDPNVTKTAVAQPTGYVANSQDCDDSDSAINPDGTEVCDGVNDEDCDGSVDEGCLTWYEDGDGDSYGNVAVSTQAMAQPGGYVADSNDCDDTDPAVNPGAVEVCDTIDNDCDGFNDEGCLAWYADSDGDGYGDAANSVKDFVQPANYVADNTDCDDTDAAVNPGAAEITGDGIDNDCDGLTDEGAVWYEDNDGDGYGNSSVVNNDPVAPAGFVALPGDCDDTDPAVNPGATEVCDGVNDEDCDGAVDEGCQTWYEDSDGDGFGNAAVSTEAVVQPGGYVGNSTDCDDTDAAVNPGAAEVCGDGVDNNCIGGVDEGCQIWYEDSDADGYGNAGVSTSAVAQPAGYVDDSTDCDDTDAAVNPGTPEVCGDNADNNCNGYVDEGCIKSWYQDADDDGYGNPAVVDHGDSRPAGYVPFPGDCDDTNAAVNPDAPEVCNDGLDNNCAGGVDEGCLLWYRDSDGDTYGDPGTVTTAFNQPANYVADDSDCNDGDPLIHPGATEACDGMDSDCDGIVDEGCMEWYRDADADGYGDATDTKSGAVQPAGYTDDSTDCDDTDAAVNPGVAEVCGDGVDNDCDGNVDEGCIVWYEDADADGYGNPSVFAESSDPPIGYVELAGDCDDTDPAVNPGMPEVCDDGLDNNCVGGVDEGCTLWYQDNDGDTYGSSVSMMNIGQPAGYVSLTGDCDDTNAAVNPAATEVCDGFDNDCDSSTDEGCTVWYEDLDNDGFGKTAVSTTAVLQPGGYVSIDGDCDDADAAINPAAVEICDTIDNDCDGITDEGCQTWYQDNDGDGFGDAGVSQTANVQPGGFVLDNTDCDDLDAAIKPTAVETCDGVDNNCAGGVDEGCLTWYADSDGDGYGNAGMPSVSIANPGGYVLDSTDCDDGNAAINPGASEVCDGVNDENCDGSVDEGCVLWYRDADGDGYGDAADSATGITPPAGYIADNTDCDDSQATVNPGMTEICGDTLDNNCAGGVDEGCLTWYEDSDGDGYGNAAVSAVAIVQPANYVLDNTDCDDTNPAMNPGAVEVCDGIDNNCFGGVDEGCLTWYEDSDGDGYGNAGVSMVAQAQPAGYVPDNTDCDDTNPAMNPGAVEICDGFDNNCFGGVDEGCLTWYEDNDGDGYGNAGISMVAQVQPAGYVQDNTDCDDANAAVNPGAVEVCDNWMTDENCNGDWDEGCIDWYKDNDGDGYSDMAVWVQSKTQPAGYVSSWEMDCDDTNAAVHPGAVEVCDGIDNNCDWMTDEGCLTWYQDGDGDGYGDPAISTVSLTPPGGHVLDNTDCDDGDPLVNPGAVELCDGLDDEDCDGVVDEGCLTWYRDADGDGYGNAVDSSVSMTQPAGYVADSTDCDDTKAGVHPGAMEICDGLDNNCLGGVDEGCLTWYLDSDGDGYGRPGVSTVSVAPPANYVSDNTDCDDTDPNIHPGAWEVCDGVNDEDCDGTVDEGCLTWYEDADGDGFGNPGASVQDLMPPPGYVSDNTDCNDLDPSIHPGAMEKCDGVNDENCDGTVDEGCSTWYEDSDGDGFGNPGSFVQNLIPPPGYVSDNTDCDDGDFNIHPGAVEVCDGLNDENCDGTVDEGCSTWYQDADGDNFGNPAVSVTTPTQPPGYVVDNTDCDDTDPSIHPGGVEICDGIDNNCEGSLDEACKDCYQDLDGDGFGNPAVNSAGPCGGPGVSVARAGDCDDGDPGRNPGVAEVCGDGIDNDCDGVADESCLTWYKDTDGDGFGDPAAPTVAQFPPPGHVADNTDCDDGDFNIHPGAMEVCDGVNDDDCDGTVDEGCATWYQDSDGDGYGDPGVTSQFIVPPPGFVKDNTDCNDGDFNIHPGAVEVCDGVNDDNCDGTVDEGCATWYQDADGDGFGDPGASAVFVVPPGGYVADNTDCDDGDFNIHPGAMEVCDGVNDENCDGTVDEGCQTWYLDSDGDGYGDFAASTISIVRPPNHVSDSTDCNDGDPSIHPGASEICDGVNDENCNGSVDEGCQIWYQDSDGDNYGDPGVSITAVIQPAGFVNDFTDCNDADPAINPGAMEVCDNWMTDENCDGMWDEGCTSWYPDNDGDNFGDGSVWTVSMVRPGGHTSDWRDCDDTDAAINPNAVEICDGIDNNCDWMIDEFCRTWYEDLDGDNFGNPAVTTVAKIQPAGYVPVDMDCDDTDAAIHPGVAEVCDGADNNCDGSVDEGCLTWYKDADGDNYGDPGMPSDAVVQPAGYVSDGTDCDDTNAAIHPGAAEVCDGVNDDDCDGSVDEGCMTWYLDSDGDNYGDPGMSSDAVVQPAGYVSDGTDCDDTNAAINPGAAEVCDGVNDDDCDGTVDEGCMTWYLDSDGDNYGDPGTTADTVVQPAGYVSDSSDCNDADAAINPGALELCDGVNDENCNGSVDEGCLIWYQDVDADNYGNAGVPLSSITKPAGYVPDSADCNDTDATVNPGADELCNDGVDNNCNGSVDEDCKIWYRDADGDGYGSAVSTIAIIQPAGYVSDGTDCDDADAAVHPGVTELCDGVDNDCDGSVDEGCVTWYEDTDNDGYGTAVSTVSVVQPVGYADETGDCDDADAAIHPGATEVCDSADNDCDGNVDEGCTTWYQDNDGDGYGSATSTVAVLQPGGYVRMPGDCNDLDPAVSPAAIEVCDSIDNDCDGAVDEGCVNWYEDFDGDNFGNAAVTMVDVNKPAGYVSDDTDCDDTNPDINPGKNEVCGDGLDNDCDGSTDEGCQTWYLDFDGDTWGDGATSTSAVANPGGYATRQGDCDDTDAAVSPDAVETCDGIDNDCDGFEDEGCVEWYQDNDGDGFGSVFSQAAFAPPAGYVAVSGDCNDSDAAVNPDAAEVCADGIDNNCDNTIDENCHTWYQDLDGDIYGNTTVSVRSIARPVGYVAANGDCNDANPVVHPFMLDLCDHMDNDCDGVFDEDVPPAEYKTYYLDWDGDGFGDASTGLEDCLQAFNRVLDATDCDDKNAEIHPGAFDICENKVDEDCSAGGDPSGDRACGMATDKGCADIADVPLETLVNSAEPIVLMLLDSSASMASEIMVPSQPDALYRGCAYYTDAISNKYVYWEAFHFETNTLYYNPNQDDYDPWEGIAEGGPYAGGPYGDADLDNVADHPNQPASTSLDAKYSNSLGVDIPIAHYYLKSELEGKVYMIQLVPDGGGYAAKYYEVTTAASDPGLVDSLTLSANPPNDVKIKRTPADARQNLANWYQYYRTRMLTASATLGKVVASVSGVQFGLNTVGVTSNSFVVPTTVDETVDGETQRQAVLTAIYEAGTAESSTDLRKNFETLGEYLECNVRTDDCPWASAEDGGECQLAFVILMTDALYSKSSTTSVGDADADGNTDFDGVPFADAHGQDETLADIAMHYYERDLAPWLDDKVPTTAKDLAEHQHMITFAVSFGAKGTLVPENYVFDHTSSNCAEGAACPTVDGPCACAPYWPEIPETQYAEPEKIDDIYHAAVNGRGEYHATQNVGQLAQAMKDIFNAINQRRGSGASVAVSTQELTEDTSLYRGLYNTAGWFGELGCWQIDPTDGSVNDTPNWLASVLLDARDLAADPRDIFTFDPTTASGVTFDLANLNDEQKDLLGDDDGARQQLIDYIKGDRTMEAQNNNGGSLRNRVSRLGDIVHSAPVHVLYPSAEYIFVGANDGMLHAFDAASSGNGGTEVFGYVPSLVFETLYLLTDPDYVHKYYVDVTPYVDSSGLLIGGLGAGGKGYFALDVSDPAAFTSADVLWEYPPGADDDMGFAFAKPIIVPHQSGRVVVFGNGYDSKNGHAVLYVIRIDANNAITPNLGEGVVKIDTLVGTQSSDPANQTGCNGLSSTLATDVDYDNTLDYIYAGDLQGNMWKFDLTADAPADWDVFYEDASGDPAPLFTAEYAAGVPQPIYAKAGAMRHCLPNRNGYIIVFGTGKFFANGDYQDTSQQSIYGIWDWAPELEDGGIADPGKYPIGTPTRVTDYASVPIDLSAEGPTAVSLALIGQTAGAESGIYRETSANRLYDRYIDPDGTPNNADDQRAWFDAETWAFKGVTYTDWRYVGWYFDLPNTGERVIADTTIRAGLAIMVSVDPSPTPCKPGGNSILQIIQACDGSRPPDEVLDFNDDGILNEDDYNWNRKELDDIYYKPVIIEDKMYFSEDDPETGPTEHLGVAYWRFLRLVHP